VVDSACWAAYRGRKVGDTDQAQLGRQRCARASTAEGQGHGCGVQWLAVGVVLGFWSELE